MAVSRLSFRAKSLQSMRRILIHRRMDSATTLRSAQNDNYGEIHSNMPRPRLFLEHFSIAKTDQFWTSSYKNNSRHRITVAAKPRQQKIFAKIVNLFAFAQTFPYTSAPPNARIRVRRGFAWVPKLKQGFCRYPFFPITPSGARMPVQKFDADQSCPPPS